MKHQYSHASRLKHSLLQQMVNVRLAIKVIQGMVGLPSVERVPYYVYTHDVKIFV